MKKNDDTLYTPPSTPKRKKQLHQKLQNAPSKAEQLEITFHQTLSDVRNDGLLLKTALPPHQSTAEVVRTAVTQNGLALEWASYRLTDNKEVVLIAVTQNGLAFEWASYKLQNNEEVVLTAVTQNGLALKWASDELQNNEEVVLTAVTQNGLALEWASDELQNNEEVVLTAVTQNVKALKWASELKDDQKFVLNAVKQNGLAFEWASDRLKDNKEIFNAVALQIYRDEDVNPVNFGSKRLRNEWLDKRLSDTILSGGSEIRDPVEKRLRQYLDPKDKLELILASKKGVFLCREHFTYPDNQQKDVSLNEPSSKRSRFS